MAYTVYSTTPTYHARLACVQLREFRHQATIPAHSSDSRINHTSRNDFESVVAKPQTPLDIVVTYQDEFGTAPQTK